MGKLSGKVVVITGAGHGIGRATAHRMGKEGASIILAELNPEFGSSTEDAFRSEGIEATFVQTDVASREDIERAVQAGVDRYGGLDILVNNAQWSKPGRVTDLTDEDWERSINTSLTSVFRACRTSIPHMQKRGGGNIVNVSSVHGLIGGRRRVCYTTTKAAIVNLTRTMALDHAPDKIRVNCICPGGVESWPGSEGHNLNWNNRAYPEPLDYRERSLMHPIGRHGTPDEIAQAICWLVDPENSFTTGTALVVDGGLMAQSLL
jgi:NAD(P)-dependent dehydrogenase (short-subunit alcohol dehydrogenase family)